MSATVPATDGSDPRIVAATLSFGHDGAAEAVIEVRFANGAQQGVTFTCDALAPVLEREGIDRLEDLVGRPWDVLLGAP